MADATPERFEIKAHPYHPSSGDTYGIYDHQTGEFVPMHSYSDSKWNSGRLQQLCAFLNELASPAPLDPEWEQERPIIEAVEAEHNPEYLSDDECLALRTLPPG